MRDTIVEHLATAVIRRVIFDKGSMVTVISRKTKNYKKKSTNDFIPQQVFAITRLHDVAAANHCCLSIQ